MTINQVHPRPARRVWLASFAAVTLILLAVGYGYYRTEQARTYREFAETLTAVNKMKSAQIEEWRSERLIDIRRVVDGPMLKQAAANFLAQPAVQFNREKLLERLRLERMGQLYDGVALFDPDGRLILSTEGGSVSENQVVLQNIRTRLTHEDAVFSNLFSASNGDIFLDSAAGLKDADGHLLGIVIQRSKAENLLYTIIQYWPTSSRTAETVLVQREGQEVVFLNELRFRAQSALALRLPLTRTEVPAVQAALGHEGIFEGIDYRCTRVLADVRSVAGSPWFLVTKMDSSEILAATRYRTGVVVAIVTLLVVLAGTATAYGYIRRQALLSKDLYEAERRQRELHDEFRTILYSIGDGVITTDLRGRVRKMNQVAEQLCGWKEAEAQGRPLEEVFRIVNETTRAPAANPVDRVLRDGVVVGLANHTLLIARDGSERPIADSAAPVRASGRDPIGGVVLIFRDQTAERAAVAAILEREQMLQESQKVAALGSYVLDFAKGVWKSSPILDEIWGIGADQDRSVAGWASIVSPADRTMMVDYFTQEVVGKGKSFDKEYRIIRPKDGVERWVHGMGKLEFDANHQPVRMVGTIRDITQQRQLAEALRSSQAELAAIYDHAPVIMCLLDEELRIVHLNRTAAQFTRNRPETLLGLRECNLIGCIKARHDADGRRPGLDCKDCLLRNAILDTIATGDSHLGVEAQPLVVGEKNPKTFHLIVHTARLEISGQKRVLLCMVDDTERKQAAAELQEIAEKFRQVQKIEAIGQLAGGVAHDFNNILASVLLQIGLLQSDPAMSGEIRVALREMEKVVQRGASLTKQLLAFSRQQAMELKTVAPDEILGSLLTMLQRLLGEQITLTLRRAGEIPRIDADAAMLELVVINLCINARDAMPKGGQVTLHLEAIDVNANATGAHAEAWDGRFVRLSVSDTGCGMDEKVMERIFEPFFTTKEVGKGTGLGLATVYGIVKQHRGWVEVQSTVGLGSTFRVYLPVGETSGAKGESAEEPPLARGKNQWILLAEDDTAVRNGLTRTLRYHGYNVIEAASGPEALAKWKTHAHSIDLLFTDMVMPEGMTGLELAERLRQDRPELKVIVYTGYSPVLIGQPFDAKMRITLLRKPSDTAQLLAAIRQSLDESISPHQSGFKG